MVIPENIHTSNIIQTKQVVFMYLEMHMCVTTISVKRDHEFEREGRKVYGLDEGKEKERYN